MIAQDLTAPREVGVPQNPFPGLRPFEFQESHLYFGRDGQSDQLIRKLSATRFVAVVGTSGSGKSSLVRAGLLPDLYGGFMAGVGSNWRAALVRPGSDPLGNLARALNEPGVFGSEIEENASLQAAITEATLRRGSLGLVEAVRHNRMPSNEQLLVVVDQFEELFRFVRVSRSEQYRYEAAAFVKLLLEAARQREQAVYVVITMRSDFLGDCSLFWDLPEAINEGQYLIPRLTRDQRKEAVEGPVAVCGGHISQRLVNRLLNDTGDDQDQLPILQHALMRTWDAWAADHAEGEPVDLRHYEATGGMDEALSRHADEAFGELPDERGREVAEKIFKGLTEKEAENREIRRPTEFGALCALAEASEAEARAVIELFRQEGRTFLMPPAGVALTAHTLVDISHESLIRNWARLKAWVDEEAASAQIYRRLAETAVLHERGQAGLWRDPDLQLALDWREQRRPNEAWAVRYHPAFAPAMKFLDESVAAREAEKLREERRRQREIRRARITAAVFGLLFFLALGAFAYAYDASRRAEHSLREAVQANEFARAQQAEAEQQRAEAVRQRSAAVEQRDVATRQTELARRKEAEAREAQAHAQQQQQKAETERARAEEQTLIAAESARRAEAAKLAEAEQRTIAEERATRNRQLLYAADLNLAQQAYLDSSMERGRQLLDAHRPGGPGGDAAGFEYFYLWRLFHSESATVAAHTKAVKSIAVSPDGSLLASASRDHTIKLWDAATHRELLTIKDNAEVNSVAFSPDGLRLATGNEEKGVKLWDASTGRLLHTLEGHEGAVKAVAFSPDGATLATAGEDRTVRLWDAATGRQIKSHKGTSYINAVAFSPDGSSLVFGDQQASIGLWEYHTHREPSATDHWTAGAVNSIAFSPEGIELIVGHEGGSNSSWYIKGGESGSAGETKTQKQVKPSGPPQIGNGNAVKAAAYSPDKRVTATARADSTVTVLDYVMARTAVLKGHAGSVNSVAFLNDGLTLVTGGDDGALKFWDVRVRVDEQAPVIWWPHVKGLVFSPDGGTLASANEDRLILWDTRSRETLAWSEGVTAGVLKAVGSAPGGRTFATGDEEGVVRLWERDGNKLVTVGPELRGHAKMVIAVVFTGDGRRLLSGSWDGTVKVWDVAARRELPTPLPAFGKAVNGVALSRDGKRLAVGTADGAVRLFDAETYQELPAPEGYAKTLWSLAFSPDGRWLAAGYADGVVKLWDLGSGGKASTLNGHSRAVLSLNFSPDGQRLASGSEDGYVKLWDAALGAELVKLAHGDMVSSVVFSPDGRLLATGSEGALRVWHAAPVEEVRAADAPER